MGSRILSRSFTVEKWDGNTSDQKQNDNSVPADTDGDDAMETDEAAGAASLAIDGDGDTDEPSFVVDDEDDSDDKEDDAADVAMVPMADMLNARYGSENVRAMCSLIYRFLAS